MGLRSALRRVGPLGTALTLGQLAVLVHRHWQTIPAEHRDRLAELLRKSRGRPGNLSRTERQELRGLVRKLDLVGLLRNGAPTAAMLRRQLRD
jgi:hypothetical protein